ncbi:MAG: SCO family protein [Pseudomonadota bacterium]
MRIEYYAGAAIFAVALGVGAGIYITRGNTDQYAQCREGAVAGGSIGGPFTLVSETGETVTDTEVLDKPSILYFGYTFCPDVCPLDTVRNADATAILAEQGYDVTPIFISVDPTRDTPEVMDEFTSQIDDSMLGLTGNPEQIASAASAYKVYYKSHEDSGDEFYLVDHSTYSYLTLPGTGFVEFFSRDVTAEQMAETTACFIAAT